MFWILCDMFNMSFNIVNYLFKIASVAISLLPIMRNLLVFYSFLCLTSSLCLPLHGLCLTNLQRKDESSKKRRNTVSFASDQLGHNDNQRVQNMKESVVSNENNKSTFKDTRDYWNQIPNTSILKCDQRKYKNKLKKAKSLDYLTYKKDELETNEFRDQESTRNEKGPNFYGKVKHETVFMNENEEDSSDDLELVSSDEDSFNNSKVE